MKYVIVKPMNVKTTKTYAFVLGREKEIALFELKTVLSNFGFCFDIFSISDNVVFANIDDFVQTDAKRLIDTLGGTTKCFEVTCQRKENLDEQIVSLVETNREKAGKLNFGVSWFGKNKASNIFQFGLGIKKMLKTKGFSVRYVESKEPEISTLLSVKNFLASDGIEIGVFDSGVGFLLAVSNPYEWSKRDYGKPASDKFSGMVPPKLARTMINLVVGQTCYAKRPLIIDPFCGSGNVLIEAMMLGYDVSGSDISEKAVADSIKNIEWIRGQYPVKDIKSEVVRADATRDSLNDKWQMINDKYDGIVVVTEPYLGEPKKYKPTLNAAKGEYEKVKETYLGFLKNLATIASNNLQICLVFPLVETIENKRYSLFADCVDEIKKLGYTHTRSFIYGRDYQVVKREIILLKQKSSNYKEQ